MKKRKKLIISITLSVFLIVAVSFSIAYFSNADTKENKFTVTKGDVSIKESFPEVSRQDMDNTFQKKVQVTNNGSSDCFVRMYVDFSDSRVRDKVKILCGGITYYSWSDFLERTGRYSDWEYVSDNTSKLSGYFYYKKVVPVNGTTDPLFTQVKLKYAENSEDSNTDKIADFDIIVYSETVQTTEINSSGTVYSDSDWRNAWRSFLKEE